MIKNFNIFQGGCFLFRAWESVLVGMIGGLLTCVSMPLLDKLGIDDPVGASATHGDYCKKIVFKKPKFILNSLFFQFVFHQYV